MKVAFIGHRQITINDNLQFALRDLIEKLILHENADTFLFGSKSAFDTLCYKTVTELKKSHPHIRRIYVRGEYQFIDKSYENYLLSLYEDTFYPDKIVNSGKKAYVERNNIMIDMCDLLVMYYCETYSPVGRSSGTQIAYKYARQKKKRLYNLYDIINPTLN